MADDAAGAVRRTQELIDTAAKAIVANPNLVAAVVKACKCCTSDHYEPGGGAPYPAECRWCDHEPNRHGEAELAKLRVPVMDSVGDLLASPDQRRPVVLLRAEDCACPVGGDCSHGPEPVDALDLAVWLHAELQHKLTLPCGECHPCTNWADETWRRAGRKPPHVITWEDKLAETRGLYARLDDAIKLIEEMSNHLRQEPALTIGVETRLAALRADEPTEPDARCMDGPAKQHTLHMVGIIKALKSAAGMDHLPLEPPRRDNFARLARAIVDYWPREIGQPVAGRDAILPRLAELTEEAGKQRSTEWLRTCATLPMEEWPPAPAYKGPMVPAAERDALSLLLRSMARKLVGYRRWTLGDDVPAVHRIRRERDALQARLDDALAELAKYEPTPGCCTACTGVGTVPTGYPCEDCYATGHCHPETVACTGKPAALQGDQPAEGPRWWGTEDGGIAAVMCGDCHTLGGHDDDCPRRQPTGEVDRG